VRANARTRPRRSADQAILRRQHVVRRRVFNRIWIDKQWSNAFDFLLTLKGQERLVAAAQMVKKTQCEGSFADQLIDFVASPTQDDREPNLSIVRTS